MRLGLSDCRSRGRLERWRLMPTEAMVALLLYSAGRLGKGTADQCPMPLLLLDTWAPRLDFLQIQILFWLAAGIGHLAESSMGAPLTGGARFSSSGEGGPPWCHMCPPEE